MTPKKAILQLANHGIATACLTNRNLGCKYVLRRFAPYMFVSPFGILNGYRMGVWGDYDLALEAENAKAYLPKIRGG